MSLYTEKRPGQFWNTDFDAMPVYDIVEYVMINWQHCIDQFEKAERRKHDTFSFYPIEIGSKRFNAKNGQIEVLCAFRPDELVSAFDKDVVRSARRHEDHGDLIRQIQRGAIPSPFHVFLHNAGHLVVNDGNVSMIVAAHDAGVVWFPGWYNSSLDGKARWRYLEASPFYQDVQKQTGKSWEHIYENYA
jgi:hypothetical protein